MLGGQVGLWELRVGGRRFVFEAVSGLQGITVLRRNERVGIF